MIDQFPTRAKALDLRPYQLAAVEAVRAHIGRGSETSFCARDGQRQDRDRLAPAGRVTR